MLLSDNDDGPENRRYDHEETGPNDGGMHKGTTTESLEVKVDAGHAEHQRKQVPKH